MLDSLKNSNELNISDETKVTVKNITDKFGRKRTVANKEKATSKAKDVKNVNSTGNKLIPLKQGNEFLDMLMKIYGFMKKTHDQDILRLQKENNFREEKDFEAALRHKKLMDALTALRSNLGGTTSTIIPTPAPIGFPPVITRPPVSTTRGRVIGAPSAGKPSAARVIEKGTPTERRAEAKTKSATKMGSISKRSFERNLTKAETEVTEKVFGKKLFAKFGARLFGIINPLVFGWDVYEAMKWARSSGLPEELSKGAGKDAQNAFRNLVIQIDPTKAGITQDQAAAALESGSERDIFALGGRELLERIANPATTLTAPQNQPEVIQEVESAPQTSIPLPVVPAGERLNRAQVENNNARIEVASQPSVSTINNVVATPSKTNNVLPAVAVPSVRNSENTFRDMIYYSTRVV